MALLKQNNLSDNNLCFACGQENPHGLRMRVSYENDKAVCRLTLPSHYQGWEEIAHGGIVSTILDEMMAYAVIHFLGQGVTLRMETTFRQAVPLGQELLACGWVAEQRGRRAEAAAEIKLAGDGAVLAQGRARWLLKLGPDGRPLDGGLWADQGP